MSDPYEQMSRLQSCLDGSKTLPFISDPEARVEGGFDFQMGDFLIVDKREHLGYYPRLIWEWDGA